MLQQVAGCCTSRDQPPVRRFPSQMLSLRVPQAVIDRWKLCPGLQGAGCALHRQERLPPASFAVKEGARFTFLEDQR